MTRAGRLRTLLMTLACGLVAPFTGWAQAPKAIGVRDSAKLFSKGAVANATGQLHKVYDQSKMQVAIETVESLDGRTVQAQATANARALKVHGLYVLLAKKERKIAAEPSDQAKSVFNAARCEAIVQAFSDGLRGNKPDEGLSNAVAAIVRDTGGTPPQQSSPSRVAAAEPPGVYDNARIFTNEAARDADKALKDLEKHAGKWQAVVETVGSLDGRDIKDVLTDHAKARDVRGIYVLISRDDKKYRVERSKSAADVFTQARIDAITRVLGDSFKAGDFDQGLKSAVAEIRKSVDSNLVAAAPAPAPAAKPGDWPGLAPQPGAKSAAKPTPPGPGSKGQTDKPLLPGPGESAAKSAATPSATTAEAPRADREPAPTPAPAPKAKPSAGIPRPLIFLALAGAVIVGIILLRKMFGGRPSPQYPPFTPANAPGGNANAPGFGPAFGGQQVRGNAGPMVGGQPGYNPGYGPPPPGGYPPGYAPPPNQGGGMGNFVTGALGGAAGAVAGNILYDQFGRPRQAHASEMQPGHPTPPMPPADGYNADNAAVGGWDAPAPPAPEEWGGAAGGAEGGWDNTGAGQGGGDWGAAENSGGQGDWGTPADAAGQGEWGADPGAGGGDWGDAAPDDGGGDGGGDWGAG